jgi:hypothetical protein
LLAKSLQRMSDPPKPTFDELYPLLDPAVIEANRKKRQERQRARWKLEAERRARAKIPVPHLGVAAYFSEPVFGRTRRRLSDSRRCSSTRDGHGRHGGYRSQRQDKRNDSKAIRVGGKNGSEALVAALHRRDLLHLRLRRTSR